MFGRVFDLSLAVLVVWIVIFMFGCVLFDLVFNLAHYSASRGLLFIFLAGSAAVYVFAPTLPFFGRFIVLSGVYRSSVYNFEPAFLFMLSCVLVCIFMLIRKNNIFF